MKKLFFMLLFVTGVTQSINAQSAKIEYIAHSAFVIESSQGTRVLIDPYRSYDWLGYTFPETQADFVLITHPHYDHDASRYFSQNVPVFREAGSFQFKDIKFEGLASKHGGADFMEKRGLQVYNTIWTVEVDGIKIAHFGDNDPPTDEEMEKMGKLDFVIGQTDDIHLNKVKGKAIYIPNHYRLSEVTDYVSWMGPVRLWLKGKSSITRLESNELLLSDLDKARSNDILVFKPSPRVKGWSDTYLKAHDSWLKARQMSAADSIPDYLNKTMTLIDEMIDLAPYSMNGPMFKATLLVRQEKYDEAINVLEKGFARIPDMDWGRETSARKLLANAYDKTGQTDLAKIQYQWIARQSRISNLNDIKAAEEYIKNHPDK